MFLPLLVKNNLVIAIMESKEAKQKRESIFKTNVNVGLENLEAST
jgi:hypothetical protein